jgi:hypothetical protein
MVSTAFKGGMKSGGKMWLPAGSSPTAKMGVLDADGNPSIQPLGEKAAKAVKKAAEDSDDIAGFIDRNSSSLVGVSKSEQSALKKLNENSTQKEFETAIDSLMSMDVETFNPYRQSWDSVRGGLQPVWNEYARQLTKISRFDTVEDVRQLVDRVKKTSVSAGKHLQNPDRDVAIASASRFEASRELKADPIGFYKRQGEFYEKEFPKLAERLGRIRIAQIRRQEAEMEKAEQARRKTKTSTQKLSDADFDADFASMF